MRLSLQQPAASEGFANSQVPEAAQGSGWKVFFIVAGTLCGLPGFLLSARVTSALGFEGGSRAILLGAMVLAAMGAISAYAGSRTRMSVAMLSDRAFGRVGGRLVKLVVALSLVGWFGVIVSVVGATASEAIAAMAGIRIDPPLISIPLSVLIAYVALRGATGLEHLGMVLLPIVVFILAASVLLTTDRLPTVLVSQGNGTLSFGEAVSAVIGAYIVGIVIQPDYGRFVRTPRFAALGAIGGLAIAYPLILITSSIASLALGKPDLVGAMITLGFGIPALAVLCMGAWIDASASLYSGGLSLANQYPQVGLAKTIIYVTIAGVIFALFHGERAFLPFLMWLSVALPPVAAVQVSEALWPMRRERDEPAVRWSAASAWLLGFFAGAASYTGWWSITGSPAIDAVLGSAAFLIVRPFFIRPVPVPATAED